MLLCRLTLETEWGTFWHMDMEKSRPLKRNKHTAVTELRPPWVLDLKYSDLLTWRQNSHGCLFWLLLRWAHPDVCFTGYWHTETPQSKTEWLWVRLDSSKTLAKEVQEFVDGVSYADTASIFPPFCCDHQKEICWKSYFSFMTYGSLPDICFAILNFTHHY